MRDDYDFAGGIRGKYAGKVDTTDIRVVSSARGLDSRHCDLDDAIRRKRGDTLVGTLRKTYGPEFARGVRSDTRLDTLRKRAGGASLAKILKVK